MIPETAPTIYSADIRLVYPMLLEPIVREAVDCCPLFASGVERPSPTGDSEERVLVSEEVAGHRADAVVSALLGRLESLPLETLQRLRHQGTRTELHLSIYVDDPAVNPELKMAATTLARLGALGLSLRAGFRQSYGVGR